MFWHSTRRFYHSNAHLLQCVKGARGCRTYGLHKYIDDLHYICKKAYLRQAGIGYLFYHDVFNAEGFQGYQRHKIESKTLDVEDLLPGHLRLLEVSAAVALPIHRWIRLNITGADVVHSWAVPSFGAKHDGVPGRLHSAFTFIFFEGLFYGQCSEFCGDYHYKMSIAVRGT